MFGLSKNKDGGGGNLGAWLILGLLTLAFGLTFGLPSDQLTLGEGGLVKIHGTAVTKDDYACQHQAVSTITRLPQGEQAELLGVKQEILDSVVERLVLVELAKDVGLAAEVHDAELLTTDGFLVVLGLSVDFLRFMTLEEFDGAWKAWVLDNYPK